MRALRSIAVAAGLLTLLPFAHGAAPHDPEKLPVTRIRDLHYGDVLFYFYQGEDFEAITRLNAYDHWKLLPNHQAESQLLLGGLYLSLGLHNEAGERFERLLTPDIPAGVRNRAWFYLGKVWYARGYLQESERALRQVQGELNPALEAERQLLLANVLMRQGRFADAEQLLERWHGPADWMAYARFNLGVALVRQNRIDDAARFLGEVGTMEADREELLALRDRANLALGFAYLQADRAVDARPVLERVRLSGPYSSKALLGTGWADAALGDYQKALTPWLELRGRNLLDAAVQESYLAVPYAFGKLQANAQSAEYYESAMRSFDDESARIDQSIGRIRAGHMLDDLLASEPGDKLNRGWFWQLRKLPDAPESRYLYPILAGHDFQEGLKNYRDLTYLGGTLDRWSGSMEAFDDMIDARRRAYAQRLPTADALLEARAVDRLRGRRDTARAELDEVERRDDVAMLGTAAERQQWARIQEIEAQLAGQPQNEETAALRDRLRLVKGVLYFRMTGTFKARLWKQRRGLRDLDTALREAELRWTRLEQARRAVTDDTGVFSARIAALRERITNLQTRLAAASRKQNDHLARLAVAELETQKERLGTYQVQARFALAEIYDRAANPPSAKPGESPADTPAEPPR